MYTCAYNIYIYIDRERDMYVCLSLYIYIYIYICVYIYIYACAYIYILVSGRSHKSSCFFCHVQLTTNKAYCILSSSSVKSN